MKEKIKKIGKWLILLVILLVGIYILLPKYHFITDEGFLKYRCNKITGQCDARSPGEKNWRPLPLK